MTERSRSTNRLGLRHCDELAEPERGRKRTLTRPPYFRFSANQSGRHIGDFFEFAVSLEAASRSLDDVEVLLAGELVEQQGPET